jgi:osmotically-inducible protein OsmY
MDNSQLQQAVLDELAADPKIDPREVAVSVSENGVVNLRGTVGSLRQRREAAAAVKRVQGVLEVKNNVDVRPLIGDRREDAVVRGEVLQALTLNSTVPSTVDARVTDGVVTLSGTVNWNFEREEAETTSSNVRGVRGIRSEIVLVPTSKVEDVKQAIEEQIKRNASIDADSVSVVIAGGKVTLKGFVSSWAARDAAINAAWSAPNVTEVIDNIGIRH